MAKDQNYRDASTGEFVTDEYAKEHPDTTVLDTMVPPRPNLGLATTKQLIDELSARAAVAETIGEEWPNYTTVGSE